MRQRNLAALLVRCAPYAYILVRSEKARYKERPAPPQDFSLSDVLHVATRSPAIQFLGRCTEPRVDGDCQNNKSAIWSRPVLPIAHVFWHQCTAALKPRSATLCCTQTLQMQREYSLASLHTAKNMASKGMRRCCHGREQLVLPHPCIYL